MTKQVLHRVIARGFDADAVPMSQSHHRSEFFSLMLGAGGEICSFR